MKQQQFIQQVAERIKDDKNVIGLAVAGSFITNEVDEFSDVDLILITLHKIAPDFSKMEKYARSFGDYLNGFTGEHVGERRLLICMYDNPLLHVDIKFLTIDEFQHRIENPLVVFDRDKSLEKIINTTQAEWPKLDFQWIEDRFWTWVHYATVKLGRGENFEALEFLSLLRTFVLSPLLQIKNGKLPRGLRKVEMNFDEADLNKLIGTVSTYETSSLFECLNNAINLYLEVRQAIFPGSIRLGTEMQIKVLDYLNEVKKNKIT